MKRNDADGIFFSNGPTISFAEAAAVMRTGESTIRALTYCADDMGRPVLKFAPLPYQDSSTPPPIFLCKCAFESFASRHATLGFMATERGASLADLEMDLVAQGVRPILERGKDHDAVYRRSGC